jgi:hypothetical protein
VRRLLVVLVPLMFVAFAPGAPVPQDRKKPTLYHPTTKGAKWVFDYEGRDDVLVVTAAERRGECWIVTVCAEDGDEPLPRWTVAVFEKGIYKLTDANGKLLCIPECVVRLPARVGDTWEKQKGSSKATVGAIEKVEVPAGTYIAIRVDWDLLNENNLPLRATWWYAPDVGPVKMKYGETVSVLKSFTPASK